MHSFFDGDYDAAIKLIPFYLVTFLLWEDFYERVPVKIHVSYEDVAQNPENVLQQISSNFTYTLRTQRHKLHAKKCSEGLGDPIGVQEHQRPVGTSIHKWAKNGW